jgi:hypothetical protein
MRESRTYGFVRGAHSNMRPYRDTHFASHFASNSLNVVRRMVVTSSVPSMPGTGPQVPRPVCS